MNNWKSFCKMVDELLKNNLAYENEIKIFKKYLEENNLKDCIFNLNVIDIDNYFKYCFENKKIGSTSALIAHFAALKMLFKYLEGNNINFKNLHGYINLDTTMAKFKADFSNSLRTSIIDDALLRKILYLLDMHIEKNINRKLEGINVKKRFLNTLVARIYIKLSLILPLKINEMINLDLYNVRDEGKRYIEYNEIIVKIPNSIRLQILQTIDYIENNCDIVYQQDEKLFEFLLKSLGLTFAGSSITAILSKTYEEIGIEEMQEKREAGVKNRNKYTPECYKTTAILKMLENGTDILALRQLTGLDFLTLVKNYDIDTKTRDNDIKSTEINSGIMKSDYFTYL